MQRSRTARRALLLVPVLVAAPVAAGLGMAGLGGEAGAGRVPESVEAPTFGVDELRAVVRTPDDRYVDLASFPALAS